MTMMKFFKILLLISAVCLASCTATRTVYVPTENTALRTDTLRLITARVDTVVQKDSVYMAVKGDTVYIEKYRDRYKVRLLTDTVYRSRTDSVYIEKPMPVEKPLTRWQSVKQEAGGLAIGAVVLLLLTVSAWGIWKLRNK